MLILARHGRTAANAAGLLQGRMDNPLDDVGHHQATCLGEALGSVDRVIVSPLLRARQTAAPLGLDAEVDERWMEVDYGRFDGVALAEVPAPEWAAWRADPACVMGGGESLVMLLERVQPALEELAEAARRDTVVVVSHVSPIKAAVAWALGVSLDIAWRFQLDQASITRIAFGRTGPSVTSLNETWHLSVPGTAASVAL
jgi:broad specificity phosphatase PhoE